MNNVIINIYNLMSSAQAHWNDVYFTRMVGERMD